MSHLANAHPHDILSPDRAPHGVEYKWNRTERAPKEEQQLSGKVFALIGLALLLGCTAAWATQNLNSATGYVLMPDAGIAPTQLVQVSGAYVASEGTNELTKAGLSAPCHGRGFNFRALTGLSDRAEAGLGWLNVHKSVGDASAFTLAGKAKLFEKPECKLALSAGLLYRSWTADMTVVVSGDDIDVQLPNVTTLYLALDKEFECATECEWTLTGTLGLAYDSFSTATQHAAWPFADIPGIPIDSDGKVASQGFIMPFIGVKASNGEWTLLGDFKPREKKGSFIYANTAWSLAARRTFAENWTATFGFTNFNLPYTSSKSNYFLDVSYRFGK